VLPEELSIKRVDGRSAHVELERDATDLRRIAILGGEGASVVAIGGEAIDGDGDSDRGVLGGARARAILEDIASVASDGLDGEDPELDGHGPGPPINRAAQRPVCCHRHVLSLDGWVWAHRCIVDRVDLFARSAIFVAERRRCR